ncbi:phosphatidylinositol glycan anchor biosynthesis class U protein isoform X2 [Cephus cinctus]|uniref:Phosphatidylinositol glycan anchor biosynthesis class U protein isoform X2 n=1 Tax=Cephus cinctus TaxID=211228 RepID=A0AAJ7CCY7_CEPCN|nr:phosphatidylinositol glycan anchor biosynthesis class U protein isoform X2 [Cephus cinctus]
MKKQLSCFALAGAIRLLLMTSDYQTLITDRVEVSTALNSWKKEGVYLHNAGIDPYSGELFHESPIGLLAFSLMQKYLSIFALHVLFIITDLATAWILASTAQLYMAELIAREKEEKSQLPAEKAKDNICISVRDTASASILYVPATYLLNPFIVLNCVGLTTTVFTNFLFALTLFSIIRRSVFWSCLSIALLTLQGLYPVTLMVPATIYIAGKNSQTCKVAVAKIILTFLTLLVTLLYASYYIMGSWSFLWNTIGFILIVPDLRPNIGLYWYFFTEMFEHFRWLFVASFQINVGLLYIVPLALRLRQDPMLLAFSYLAIAAIFKSYPCLGDVGFYMALLPMWKHLFRHMQQGFIVSCFLLFCTVFAPTVWHQWIYSRSANANFYFGVTLAFAVAQIFLLTDILFASVKREFALRYGLSREVNGNKAKLLLE